MKISTSKCKSISPDPLCNIQIEGETVEKVENFIFLGSVVPYTSDDVERRIALASSAFDRLKKNIWL